jgi:hypothetical protein
VRAAGGSIVTFKLRISLLRLVLALLACTSFAAHAADPRSAQGDCTREAQRRGYQVLETTNFRQYNEGWTLDLRVRYRTGRTDSGTCFVDNRTGRVNLFNFNEGATGGGSGRGRCVSAASRSTAATVSARFRSKATSSGCHGCRMRPATRTAAGAVAAIASGSITGAARTSR